MSMDAKKLEISTQNLDIPNKKIVAKWLYWDYLPNAPQML